MAKLQSLKMRKDEGERQIKCLVVMDSTNGDVIKYYDPMEFEELLQTVSKDKLVKVYSPSVQEKQQLLETIKNDIVVENDNVNVTITETDMIVKLFTMFTDLEIDLEDKESIEEVIANPNEMYLAIKIEIDKILMSTFESFIATHQVLLSNPQTTEMISKNVINNEEDKLKKARIQELKAQLAELGVE